MYIDGKNIWKDFNIGVSRVKGGFDILSRKKPYSHSWEDEHGEDYFVDRENIIYQARKINLSLFVHASNALNFEHILGRFTAWMDKPGLRCLSFDNMQRPFYAYPRNGASIDPLALRTSGRSAAEFKLTLIEPEPVYPYLGANVSAGQSVSLTLQVQNGRTVRVYWGDGDFIDFNNTTAASVSHTYNTAGTYKIAILENIADLTRIEGSNGAFQGDIAGILKNLPTGNIKSVDFANSDFTHFSGGKIPHSLTNLDFYANNLGSSEEVNRVVQYLLNDGTWKASDRSSSLNVTLSGSGMAACTDTTSKNAVDAEIGILTTN